jgi:hypothetical protein
MCWNQKVSMNTFLFSMFAASLALKNGVVTTPDGLFYIFFSSMQLVEYFLWKNLDNKKGNEFWSKVGLLFIALQPVVSMWAIKDHSKRNIGLGLYLVGLTIVLTVVKPLGTIDFSSHRAPNGHLAWNWNTFPTAVVALYVMFQLSSSFMNKDYMWFGITMVITALIYRTYIQSGTWGSMWCWISAILGVYLLIKVFRNSICL